jgi:glyoxylate utilization-related uncharacterized protein
VICQRTEGARETPSTLKPILSDSLTFTGPQTRYSNKKQEIRTIVHFVKKYKHLVDTRSAPSVICTNDSQIRALVSGLWNRFTNW